MDRLQGWIGLIISLMVYLTDHGFGYAIIEGPQNLTVVVGSMARFNCTVSNGWKILIWLLNGDPKLSVPSVGDPIVTDNRYTQKGYNTDSGFTSELMIHDVQLNDSGQIRCSIQYNDDNRSAFLSVQINGSLNIKNINFIMKKNQTIEIVCEALGWSPAPHISWMRDNHLLDHSMYVSNYSQVSNGLYNEESILTLTLETNNALACLAAIDALSKPQSATVTVNIGETSPIKSNYQNEIRKISGKKERDRNLETVSHSGKENYGYSEDQIARDHTSFPVKQNFYNTKQDPYVSSSSKVPNNGLQTEELPSRTTVYPVNPRKIRNVTLI
ncbi:immunoglobulin superfamily member 5 isoform X3 [Python bivittatus]|uniref:immunoglobulin superfamily member 5 isoform X3 n=1 Tax=Python bivittatus TaxID=176946 RepID=UPI000778AD0C|nr:immunoglobulin superfamily member 5 isoform X3 [Python bivittatus]